MKGYPWYQSLENHIIAANEADIAIASDVFADDLACNGIKLLDLNSRCLDVAHYNRLVGNVRNKASVLFTATSQLIQKAWEDCADDQLQIIIDRQGGRVRYRRILQRMFADKQLKILKETPSASSYELVAGSRQMRVHFTVGADDRFLPVSLASMASKYIRELLVANINRYFAGYHAELKPTAGYWKDGLRFIEDLRTHIPHVQIDNSRLIRCR